MIVQDERDKNRQSILQFQDLAIGELFNYYPAVSERDRHPRLKIGQSHLFNLVDTATYYPSGTEAVVRINGTLTITD